MTQFFSPQTIWNKSIRYKNRYYLMTIGLKTRVCSHHNCLTRMVSSFCIKNSLRHSVLQDLPEDIDIVSHWCNTNMFLQTITGQKCISSTANMEDWYAAKWHQYQRFKRCNEKRSNVLHILMAKNIGMGFLRESIRKWCGLKNVFNSKVSEVHFKIGHLIYPTNHFIEKCGPVMLRLK